MYCVLVEEICLSLLSKLIPDISILQLIFSGLDYLHKFCPVDFFSAK